MPNRMGLVEMSSALESGRVSANELLDAHLTAIDRTNPRVNAFSCILADRARRSAAASEARIKARARLGALDGIPITIKESFDLAGFRTVLGSRLRVDSEPAVSSATAVEWLERAGAVILGKTNTPEFLRSYETDNHVVGMTRNPWNLERTSGGSSGGEAAAIAASCSAGGVGSDGGGSIRLPAHFCGIAGLRVTPGRISAVGHHPSSGYLPAWMESIGPMARTVADLNMLFQALDHYDPQEPQAAPVQPQPRRSLSGMCVGVMEQFLDVPVQPVMRDVVRRAAGLLQSNGLVTEEFRPENLATAPNVWVFFFAELGGPEIRKLYAGHEDEVHWTLLESLGKLPPSPDAARILAMIAERDRIRCSLLRQMERRPLLLLPVCAVPAFRPGERKWQLPEKSIGMFQAIMPSIVFNALGFPAMSIPMGLDADGLPVGVQLAARPWDEELLLEAGALLEQARGPLPPCPIQPV